IGSNLFFGCIKPAVVRCRLNQRIAMTIFDVKEAGEELVFGRSPFDSQEVNYLNEQASVTVATLIHRLNQMLQSRDESVVPDTQQRTACDIADPGGFDDDGSWTPRSKSSVPFNDI